jgi:hypothetical protein
MPSVRQKQLRKRPRPRALDVEQRLKLWLSGPRRLAWLLAYERRSKRKLSWRSRWRAFRLGFASTSYVLYELDRNDPSLYVRDFAYQDYAVLERHRAAVREKLSFSLLMRSLETPHPAPLAVLQEGFLRDLAPPYGTLSLNQLLERQSRLVFRPIAGWGGTGVFFVFRGSGGLELDGQAISASDLEARLATLDEFLITEFLDQAEYAREIYPASSNTLRLLTLWDVERHQPFLAAAVHRFGSSRSGMIDNFHQGQGGMSAPIDLETGRLGAAVSMDSEDRRVTLEHHPDTGSRIDGIVVPGWKETVDTALRVAAGLPQFPYVGWDLLPTERGAYWLEANSPPGLAVWQAHGPLLADPRARRFFDWLG